MKIDFFLNLLYNIFIEKEREQKNMAKYKRYLHIERLGNDEVEDILFGTVQLTTKIDGTNSVVWLNDEGQVCFGSRNRELTL